MLLRISHIGSKRKLTYYTLVIDENLENHLIIAKDYYYIKLLCLKKITNFHKKKDQYECSLVFIKTETKYNSCVIM